MDTDSFLKIVDSEADLIDGICWLGGDAVFQPERLIELSMAFKKKYINKQVCLYTGFLFEQLDESIKDVCDLIVDGRYEGYDLAHPATNQRIFWQLSISYWIQLTYQQFKTGEYIVC